jgi:nucleoside 2-deoxyribosyltransferase
MTDIYLTSTFSNPWNVAFNPKIGAFLEDSGISCYLAHRDTNQQGEAAEKFSSDIKGMDEATCIVAVALNETPNWGAEVGYAYALEKPVIALTTNDHAIPLICNGMVAETIVVSDLDDIPGYGTDLLAAIRRHIS